ncbi:lamin tail domain-containing protein [Winogradskyella sp. UBA3174]|uniref:lamin tail domain-containing protein n=1 Tax=Winogradskyella sp. UBA3174 TaxID=1947785 RepID=UPI0025F897C2|nr:lamin tail domain-containing protein [Winogradskyella sp. UBA3174]|tara:strand:- start:40228 stop:43461 length:3234 start_codon:yes stop_codon:yes gene_type:complete
MRQLYLFLLAFIISGLGFGQENYLVENFDYPNSAVLTDFGWFGHSGGTTNAIQTLSPGLTYPGYVGDNIGLAAGIDNTGQDVNRPFSSDLNSGSVYMSFMLKSGSIPYTHSSANPSYFMNFSSYSSVPPDYSGLDSGDWRARMFMKQGTDPNTQIQIGISFSASSGNYSADLDITKTYLVVAKYSFNPGTNDDTVSLYIFSDGNVPTTEPGTPSVGPLTGTDASLFQAIALRQFTSTQNTIVDGIYVRDEWNLVDSGSGCGVSLGAPSFTCTSNTTGADNDTVTVNIPYFGDDSAVSVSTTSAGIVGGDDPSITPNGTITLTGLTEGSSWDISISGGGCSDVTNSGTILSVQCDPLPLLIINEILADPDNSVFNGDSNNDGTRDSSEDEFIEIYNNDISIVNLTGYTISDGSGLKHTFPLNTFLDPGSFITVFGGGIPTGFQPLSTQVASVGNLSLNNGGDSVTLSNSNSIVVATETYGSEGGENQSLARNPDFTGDFEKHSLIRADLIFTPNTKNVPTDYSFSGAWLPESPEGVSTKYDNLIILSGNAVFANDVTSNNLLVEPAASLTINATATLTATSLDLESNSTQYSSLILDGSLAGNISGNVTYRRYVNNFTAGPGGNDLATSPLTGLTFFDFATDSDNSNLSSNPSPANGDEAEYLFGPFDNSNSVTYVNYSIGLDGSGDPDQTNINYDNDVILTTGKGFRVATSGAIGNTLAFRGGVNTGTVTTTDFEALGNNPMDKWNLVGNPYPSYMDAQAFLTTNGGVIDETVLDPNFKAIYGYNNNTDGNTSSKWTIINSLQNNTLNIAPGQGFFVASNNTGQLDFTPAMRLSSGGDDFIQGRDEIITYRTTLQLSKSNDSFNTDIYFTSEASLGLNSGYDAGLFGGSATPFALYSHLVEDNQGVPFAIQALGITDYSDVTIALGVNANQGEQLTFSMSFSDLPSNVEVYLEDTIANTNTLLNTSDYILTPSANLSGTGRFFLSFTNNILSVSDNPLRDLSIYTDQNDRTVIIAGELKTKTTANIYDIQGRLVTSAILNTTSRLQKINVNDLSTGIYVVKLNDTKNQNITQKVILR